MDPKTEWKQMGPNLYTNNIVTEELGKNKNEYQNGGLSLGQGDCD